MQMMLRNAHIIYGAFTQRVVRSLNTIDLAILSTKLDFFSKQGLKVSSITAGGNLTLAVTESGLAFAWPFVK